MSHIMASAASERRYTSGHRIPIVSESANFEIQPPPGWSLPLPATTVGSSGSAIRHPARCRPEINQSDERQISGQPLAPMAPVRFCPFESIKRDKLTVNLLA